MARVLARIDRQVSGRLTVCDRYRFHRVSRNHTRVTGAALTMIKEVLKRTVLFGRASR